LAPIVFTTDRRLSLDIQKLQRLVVEALEDVKAQDILVFNTLGLSDMFDRVVLASGTSNRQTRSLAWSVVEKVKEAGGKVISVEGTDPGEWVLVDLGDVVVHIMQPAVRQYYGLEEMWGAKPVHVKLVSERRGNKPRLDDDTADMTLPAAVSAKTAAAKKVPLAKKAATKAVPKTAAPKTAAKQPVTKAAAKKAAPKKAVSKAPTKAAVKKAAAKKAPVKTAKPAKKAEKSVKAAKVVKAKTAAKAATKSAAKSAPKSASKSAAKSASKAAPESSAESFAKSLAQSSAKSPSKSKPPAKSAKKSAKVPTKAAGKNAATKRARNSA
jgi:ribosome-associated protein